MPNHSEILQILQSNPEVAKKVKFVIQEEGTFVFDGKEFRSSDADRPCTIEASVKTFREILDGETNPTNAYLNGKLKIEGDMATALQISSLLSKTL